MFAHFRFDVNHVGRTYSFAARWKNAVYAICIMRHSKMHTGINSWKCVVGTWKRTQPTQQSVSRNANRCFGFFCTRWWHPWECRIFRDLLMAVRDEIPQPLHIIRLTHEEKKCAGVNVYFRRKPPFGVFLLPGGGGRRPEEATGSRGRGRLVSRKQTGFRLDYDVH